MNKKRIYLLCVILVLIGDWVLVTLFVQYERPAVELSETPNKPVDIVAPVPEPDQPIKARPVWERSLFAAYRGVVKDINVQDTIPVRTTSMELIGICQLGDASGAIIIDKSVKRSPGTRKARTRRYYSLNQTMSSGFVVKEIQKDFVRLVRGNEEVVLDLVFGDIASSSRNIKEVALQVQTKREARQPSPDRVMTRKEMMKAMEATNRNYGIDDTEKGIAVKEPEKVTKTAEQVRAEKQEAGRRLDALRRKLSLQR